MANKVSTSNPKSRKSPTKSDKIVKLLSRSTGASIGELQKATGWQPHSIRGFISGTARKRMQLNVLTEKAENGVFRYRIEDEAST